MLTRPTRRSEPITKRVARDPAEFVEPPKAKRRTSEELDVWTREAGTITVPPGAPRSHRDIHRHRRAQDGTRVPHLPISGEITEALRALRAARASERVEMGGGYVETGLALVGTSA